MLLEWSSWARRLPRGGSAKAGAALEPVVTPDRVQLCEHLNLKGVGRGDRARRARPQQSRHRRRPRGATMLVSQLQERRRFLPLHKQAIADSARVGSQNSFERYGETPWLEGYTASAPEPPRAAARPAGLVLSSGTRRGAPESCLRQGSPRAHRACRRARRRSGSRSGRRAAELHGPPVDEGLEHVVLGLLVEENKSRSTIPGGRRVQKRDGHDDDPGERRARKRDQVEHGDEQPECDREGNAQASSTIVRRPPRSG